MAILTAIDTACALLEVSGRRFVTDPVFDPPGGRYHFGWGALSTKRSSPALAPDALGAIDAVLLSHHQHEDNLDAAGRAFTLRAPLVVTTRAAARTLPNARGLAPGERVELKAEGARPALTITATPARHRPGFLPEFTSGPVVGFLLEGAALPKGALWITGDTVLFDGLREVAARATIDVLIAHVGAVRFPWLTGPARYTMDAAETVALAKLTQARRVVALHVAGWTHFREGAAELHAAFAAAGLQERLVVPAPGVPLALD